jgi:hypothetical protein
MLSLFRDRSFRAFLIGFALAGIPMIAVAGVFS